MSDDMVIFTRTYDLLEWLMPKLERFPRAQRRAVTRRLMDAALDFHEALHDARSQGGSTRKKHLRQADAALDKLRTYLRLAHHWRWLSDGQYAHVSRMVAELGRMLGGWIRAEK